MLSFINIVSKTIYQKSIIKFFTFSFFFYTYNTDIFVYVKAWTNFNSSFLIKVEERIPRRVYEWYWKKYT